MGEATHHNLTKQTFLSLCLSVCLSVSQTFFFSLSHTHTNTYSNTHNFSLLSFSLPLPLSPPLSISLSIPPSLLLFFFNFFLSLLQTSCVILSLLHLPFTAFSFFLFHLCFFLNFFLSLLLTFCLDQDTVVLGENARLLCIFSEGRKIESRRQPTSRHRINRNARKKFGDDTERRPVNDQ